MMFFHCLRPYFSKKRKSGEKRTLALPRYSTTTRGSDDKKPIYTKPRSAPQGFLSTTGGATVPIPQPTEKQLRSLRNRELGYVDLRDELAGPPRKKHRNGLKEKLSPVAEETRSPA
ncbi:MAG: hypothetical protein M1820_008512 [Bogoriella megaspora]|nr:MAG: hypothetical protein M1820_008512 [Bogoriella megaspora]